MIWPRLIRFMCLDNAIRPWMPNYQSNTYRRLGLSIGEVSNSEHLFTTIQIGSNRRSTVQTKVPKRFHDGSTRLITAQIGFKTVLNGILRLKTVQSRRSTVQTKVPKRFHDGSTRLITAQIGSKTVLNGILRLKTAQTRPGQLWGSTQPAAQEGRRKRPPSG